MTENRFIVALLIASVLISLPCSILTMGAQYVMLNRALSGVRDIVLQVAIAKSGPSLK
jgi:hypothetical protein